MGARGAARIDAQSPVCERGRVNLVLLLPDEIDENSTIVLQGRRALHLLQVLHVAVGSSVRVGLLNGPAGLGEVVALESSRITLHCSFTQEQPAVANDVLLLAMPRPKVLARCLEHAAALGFGRVVVFRSSRTVKSHFDSHILHSENVQAHLLAGLEQSRRTGMPQFQICPRFRPFVEDSLTACATPTNRYLADPDAPLPLHQGRIVSAPFTLVIGPEGGLIPFEVEAFAQQGFTVVNAGAHPLRVETALSFLSGQLHVLRELTRANI